MSRGGGTVPGGTGKGAANGAISRRGRAVGWVGWSAGRGLAVAELDEGVGADGALDLIGGGFVETLAEGLAIADGIVVAKAGELAAVLDGEATAISSGSIVARVQATARIGTRGAGEHRGRERRAREQQTEGEAAARTSRSSDGCSDGVDAHPAAA